MSFTISEEDLDKREDMFNKVQVTLIKFVHEYFKL